jgi:single-stranded-DNA-specific exonuclease
MTVEAINEHLLWVYPKEDSALVEYFIKEFNIHPATAQVLVSRKYKKRSDVHSFLYAKLPQLHSPDLLLGIENATQRIHTALKNKEKILIFGDNDVDGISGATLLVDFLRTLGANVYFYIPNRNLHRDTIILDAMEYALSMGCSCIITVDCGITAANEIKELTAKGIDVIITDHHEPTDKLPHCIATLNPKLINSVYPNRDLTGVGVAFKLAHAMINYLVKKGEVQSDLIDLKRYLDLVALGTIADMGALTGENRILVRYGLQQLQKTQRIGLLKLIHVSEVNPEEITTTDVASKVAPRLNSLGRIDDPRKGVELLLLRDMQEAETLAKELDVMNQERQRIERRDSEDIEKYLKSYPERLEEKALIIDSDRLHPGIIPIISARLAKQYNRPAIVITKEGSIGKGSIRTIPEFPVLRVLKENSELLESYGGHDFAAGFTIDVKNIPEFKRRFIAAANDKLKERDISPKLHLDAKVSFKDLTFEFLESLSLLEPYGTENPQVNLYTIAHQVLPPKIVGRKHLKLSLEDSDRFLEGIGFNMAERKAPLMKKNLRLLLAFTPHVNVYLNKSSIQLQIRDFQILPDSE